MTAMEQRQARMAKEADDRQRHRAALDQEIEAEKQIKKAKKQHLKELQDRDILLKKDVHVKREALFGNDDFKDKNIMSYCFDPKVNKSEILGRRNEQILGLLGNQFVGKDDIVRQEEQRVQKFAKQIRDEQARNEEIKFASRKRQELEIKKF